MKNFKKLALGVAIAALVSSTAWGQSKSRASICDEPFSEDDEMAMMFDDLMNNGAVLNTEELRLVNDWLATRISLEKFVLLCPPAAGESEEVTEDFGNGGGGGLVAGVNDPSSGGTGGGDSGGGTGGGDSGGGTGGGDSG
ncbi:hypothetical protein, partial [Halomonas daqiaonensis]